VAPHINKRDLPWVVLIAASFIFALAVSWQRWGNPLVDCGREMNQPLRLANGEMLYSEVRHIYGPLSPYVNAALYRLFGASLNVLYADGMITAIIILSLVYWLSRQLMGRMASTAATLSVLWLCAFKQAGNYILPYSYGALHGCALGLIALALLVKSVPSLQSSASINESERANDETASGKGSKSVGNWTATTGKYLLAAGVSAGLAALAKTEMGLAALLAGVATATLIGYPNFGRVLRLGALFLLPAIALVAVVYGSIGARVGWHTLSAESFLFLRNLSPELVYFNKRISGFDQPWESIVQMIGATIRVGLLALIIATISLIFTRRKKEPNSAQVSVTDFGVSDAGRANSSQLWMLFGLSLLAFLSLPLAGKINWDKGPYLAMPVLLCLLLIVLLARCQKQISKGRLADKRTLAAIIIAIYALASLARVILRVRSGGAYSSYLLPASVILFTYAWAHPFADLFRDGRARRLARNIAIGLILADAMATAGLLAYRYRTKNTYPLKTERGTMIAVPDIGAAMEEAIAFIASETAPGEPVAVMPEGTSLNFFTNRPNPLKEEITTPGFLDPDGEERAIRQMTDSNTRLVLIANRPTPEFGADAFGRDYSQRLMQWIDENFEPVAIFGPSHDPNLQIGDRTFFLRAYMKRDRIGLSERLFSPSQNTAKRLIPQS
jgi:4-amino-4-deoxy-L-arabinose transferase-like glycosyltransferase